MTSNGRDNIIAAQVISNHDSAAKSKAEMVEIAEVIRKEQWAALRGTAEIQWLGRGGQWLEKFHEPQIY